MILWKRDLKSYFTSRDEQIVNISIDKFAGAEWYMYIKCCATWTDDKNWNVTKANIN